MPGRDPRRPRSARWDAHEKGTDQMDAHKDVIRLRAAQEPRHETRARHATDARLGTKR